MTPFKLNYSPKFYFQIPSHWELELQHVSLGDTQMFKL